MFRLGNMGVTTIIDRIARVDSISQILFILKTSYQNSILITCSDENFLNSPLLKSRRKN